MACHGRYTTEKVTYPSHGETITGILYMPKGITNPPGVVVLGPYSFVKEQAPLQYGTRLADEGYAALIFDPRTVGESTGVPRRLENPLMKNEDVVSGLDYLASRGDVDAKKLFLVGVCQGGPECLDVASYDDRVVAVASVTKRRHGAVRHPLRHLGSFRPSCRFDEINEALATRSRRGMATSRSAD